MATSDDRDESKRHRHDQPDRKRNNFKGRPRMDKTRGVRTRFDEQPESKDAEEIRRQVEFYFSDSNLPGDRFLLGETGGAANKPVPLQTIHNFKRMRHFQPFSAVVDAVKQSQVLEVNDSDEVYRKDPLDSKFTLDADENQKLLDADMMSRTVYVKGFGNEGPKTVFEIEEFFLPYEAKSVRLRRHPDKTFKRSVFVEFKDETAAQEFVNLHHNLKFNDNPLTILSKEAYVKMKEQEEAAEPKSERGRPPYRAEHKRHNPRKAGAGKRKRDDGDDNRPEADDDDIDEDDWRARRDRFQRRGRSSSRDRDPSSVDASAAPPPPEDVEASVIIGKEEPAEPAAVAEPAAAPQPAD